MRKYEKTHPWLTFQLSLSQASHTLWIALGEARSKCEHLAGTPLLPAVSARLHALYLAKGVQATTAIEGNSLSEEQVQQRLEGELELPASQEYLGHEIDNILKAVAEIDDQITRGISSDLSIDLICHYNQLVLEGLELDKVTAGVLRTFEVSVGNQYHGAPAEDSEYLLGRMCEWLNQPELCAVGDSALIMGIIRAVLAHIYIAWIHPFGDGNGRTARLVEFLILTSAGVPSAAAQLLSNHYNQTRQDYYRQLALTSRSGGDVLPFLEYAVTGFVDGLREQIMMVREQQLAITWRDYLRWIFEGKPGKIEQRRYRLALALSTSKKPIPLSEVLTLTPQVASDYATKSRLTLMRDLAKLQEMGLILIEADTCRILREQLDAFLPLRKREEARAKA
jgi:Fic family protein